MTVPKIFHFVWVGDESKEPVAAIESWEAKNPGFETRVYRNADVFGPNGDATGMGWTYPELLMKFADRGEYNAVCDLVRWDMLYKHGGVAVDADMVAVNPIPQWILDCEIGAGWVNEEGEGELLNCAFIFSDPGHELIEEIRQYLKISARKLTRWSWSRMKRVNIGGWKTVGPMPFTHVVKKSKHPNFTSLPSHFFYANRRDGRGYTGGGPVIGEHLWGTTFTRNDSLADIAAKRVAAIDSDEEYTTIGTN